MNSTFLRRIAVSAGLCVAALPFLGALGGAAVAAPPATPVTVADEYTVNWHETLTVTAPGLLANDTNIGVNVVHWPESVIPPHGTGVFNPNGSFTFDPAEGFTGDVTGSYCVGPNDAATACVSNTATITIHVLPPDLNDDEYTTTPGTTLTVPAPGVQGNDTNTGPGSVRFNPTFPPHSAIGSMVSTDGSFTYIPEAGFTGDITWGYCLSPSLATLDCVGPSATVTIHVRAPVAVDDEYVTLPGATLTVADPGVLGNDQHVGANVVRWKTLHSPTGGGFYSPSGAFTYIPPAGFTGDVTATYCLGPNDASKPCISEDATVTIHVRTPVAVDDEYTVAPGGTLTIPAPGVLDNDQYVGGNVVRWQTLHSPTAGGVYLPGGSFTYHAPAGFTGDVTATYCLGPNDASKPCTSGEATVTVHVAAPPANPDPVGNPPPGTNSGGGLPVTGVAGWVATTAGLGTLLVLAGAVLVTAQRRRRTT